MAWQAAAAEATNTEQAVTGTEAATGADETEQAAREMAKAQKVADDYEAREFEAHWTAAVYEANERGVMDMNHANDAHQMADEREAREAAEKVAEEFEAREEHWRREKAARAALGMRAEAEGCEVSEEQVRVEIAAIEVQERGEAILPRARARSQASSDAQVAQRMAEEYAYEAEEAKTQQDADEAMARSIIRKEIRELKQGRRGADRKCPSEELTDHVEAESERKLKCEARGDKHVPIPYKRGSTFISQGAPRGSVLSL